MKKTLTILGVCLFMGSALAQPERTSFIQGSRGFSGLHCELWRYAGGTTTEFVLPLYYSIGLEQLTPGLALDAVSSPTLAFQSGAETNSLFRVAGSKIRASYNFNNLFLATAGIQVPTGPNALSADEQVVSGAISTPQMTFRVNDVQTGFNENFTLATSMKIEDDLVVGGAVGYLIRGAFTPLDGAAKFNPGNELTVTLAADYTTLLSAARLKLMGEYLFSCYSKDRSNNVESYQAAPRHGFNLRADYKPTQGLRHVSTMAFNLYGKNRVLWNGTTAARSDILLVNDYVYFPAVKNIFPHAVASANVFMAGGKTSGKAVVIGLGGGGALRTSRAMTVRGQAVFQGGMMNATTLYGIELKGGVQYVF